MSPEKTAKKVADQLMVVFKEAAVSSPTDDERLSAYGYHRAPSAQSYLLKAASFAALNRAAAKLVALIDGYSMEQCLAQLREIAVAEKDAGTHTGHAHDRMRGKILDFLKSFDNQGEWEAVFAVRGIDPKMGSFQIGPCQFYLMDDEQFNLWGRRFSSGKYEPPPNAPLYREWLVDEAPMKGQFVAAAKVRAINHEHAYTKGRHRVEEAINLLRYGQLVVGFPKNNFPEIGFWVRQWQHDHSFAIQIDRPNFGSKLALGGPEGSRYSVCVKAPGWGGLERVITFDRAARNEMQLRLTTALQWVGQAALAPSSSIRLVALVTALEALLIDESESAGKKTKLAKRITGLIAASDQEKPSLSDDVEELYRNRSECVHGGGIEVDPAEVTRAVRLLTRTIEAVVTRPPYSSAATLRDILHQIDPPSTAAGEDRLRWVTENAYLRWVSEGKPANRQLQHWLDAEREYHCNLVLKGRPLNSITGGPKADAEQDSGD